MVRCVNVIVRLPNATAEELTDVARRKCTTVDAFVASMIEEWLEQRRKEARLGKKNQTLRAIASEGSGGDS